MRLRLLAVLSLLATLCVTTGSQAEPGPGFFKTSNIDYLGSIPLDSDTAGGRLFGKTFYVLTAKGLTVYDVRNPLVPVPMGTTALPHTPNQEREDIDTNGRILIAGQSYHGILYVVDVTNPRLPTLKAALRGAADHTNTCALDCSFIYGSEGTITDLRDPANPKVVGNSGVDGHDLTEIKPGLLLTATNPVTYIDVRTNPLKPRRLATGAMESGAYYTHGVEWPQGGTDRFVLAGTEESLCSDEKLGSFQVLDTKGWQKTGRFRHVSSFYLEQGLQTDGKSPVNEYCGHWFKPRPDFKNGGIVAMAWYGFGTRFLEVTKTGEIVEKGYFTPLPGHTSSAYWLNNEIVYSLDYTARGFDILRFNKDKVAEKDTRFLGRSVSVVFDPSATASRQPAVRETPYVCPVPIA
ncbi:MAG TPA: hypothetical protein VNB94_11450 [Mycobacteriales bacterium]|nr:hypothetical protein [Mycobacteriales bacterium]